MATSHVSAADLLALLRQMERREWLHTDLERRALRLAISRLETDQLREPTKMVAEDDGEAD